MHITKFLVLSPYWSEVLNLWLTLLADHTRNRPITAHSWACSLNNLSISVGVFARSVQGISSWVDSLSCCLFPVIGWLR
jgi:hypothetical protein